MKKILVILCILLTVTNSTASVNAIGNTEKFNKKDEELCTDIISTLLFPEINKCIDKYYPEHPQVALFNVKILETKRPAGYRTFNFMIKLEVKPFVGAHNVIGIDHITFDISPTGVSVEKFEHIKSFDIPQHLR